MHWDSRKEGIPGSHANCRYDSQGSSHCACALHPAWENNLFVMLRRVNSVYQRNIFEILVEVRQTSYRNSLTLMRGVEWIIVADRSL
jgi:hypothetical protein